MAEQAKRRAKAAPGGGTGPTFGAAIDEVEKILARLESEQVDVDDLAREVRRAVELIAACRRRLSATETEVRAYVDALQAPDAAADDDATAGRLPL